MIALINISILFICLYLIFDSIEILLNHYYYNFESPISTNLFYLRKSFQHPKILKIIYSKRLLITLSVTRILVSILLLFFCYNTTISWIKCISIFSLIIFELYIRLRCQNRLSSSEHIIIFNLFCLFCFYLTNEFKILHFITLNLIICYTSNGIKKMTSPKWRNGSGLKNILNTDIYGSESISKFYSENRSIYFIQSWVIILLQTSFALYLVNPILCSLYMILGLLFHFFLALIMKLRDFFLAFLSSYPILLFSFLELHNMSINSFFLNLSNIFNRLI